MRRKLIYILLATAASLTLTACTHEGVSEDNVLSPTETPGTTLQPDSTPTPENGEVPGGNGAEIPENWETSSDPTLGVSMAHPPGWTVSPAGQPQGEFSVMSFDPDETPDTGGIPQDELKVAVIRITEGDQRSADDVIRSEDVVSSENVAVGGNQATLYTIGGGLGGSLTTEVETEDGTYFISAYPRGSELMDIYRQVLETVEFN